MLLGNDAQPPRRTPAWAVRKAASLGRFPAQAHQRMDEAERRDAATVAALTDLLAEVRSGHAEVLAARVELAAGAAQIRDLRDQLTAVRAEAATAIAGLSLRLRRPDGVPIHGGPLVSVVVATWQRAALLPRALDSIRAQTYQNWQCVVIDDGSRDGTAEAVAPYLADSRFRYEYQPQAGASAARNRALELATGELIAYLDSDNRWLPHHLELAVQALQAQPSADWAVAGQVVIDESTGQASVRDHLRSAQTLFESNFVDVNALTHRASALTELGGFDPGLRRLGDWDLVLRLATRGEPARIHEVTGLYSTSAPNRISDEESGHWPLRVIQSRHGGRPADGLTVLLAEWHYPQITETYIAAVISALVGLGAQVSVWSESDVAAPYPSPVPVLRGTLSEAIAQVRPDVVLTHWLHKGAEYREVTRAAGLPHVVRTHGFEYQEPVVDGLLADPGVLVCMFDHLVEPRWNGHPRLHRMPTVFDQDRYQPASDKDRRLVVRVAAGLLTKDIESFFWAALQCRQHRFVLVLGHAYLVEDQTQQLIDRCAELGAPVQIRTDVAHPQVAQLIAAAGVYLHTHGTAQPFGAPISMAEAMATGCYVLARDLPGAGDYLGDAGGLYDGATPRDRGQAAAELINGTLSWTDEQWRKAQTRSVDRAFQHHANHAVVHTLLQPLQALINATQPV